MNKELYYTMELQGEGIVMVKPDLAVLHLGVETTNKDLTLAQEENAKIMQEIIASLKRTGIDEEDIQTERYTINKQIDYVDGQQIDKGYVVRNILQITLRDIDRAGTVIDTAVEHGANVVNGISFEIEDPSRYYQQALNLALMDAGEKAMTMGKQMGVQVFRVPIRIVEESVSGGIPYYAKTIRSETPIEPGQNEISAKIKALFSYSPV